MGNFWPEAGVQASEIEDFLSQSQTKLAEGMQRMVENWSKATEKSLKEAKGVPVEQSPKAQNTGYY